MSETNVTVKDLNITTKDGQKLYGLTLKTKVDKKTGGVLTGLSVGESLIFEKVFAEGFENNNFEQPSYGCRVIYDDKLCGFYLNQKQHDRFKDCGGAGDNVKVTVYEREYKFKGETKTTLDFQFELVE